MKYLLLTGTCLALFFNSLFAQSPDLTLWYTSPAAQWTDALPIGNGRLGAMIYAGVDKDVLQFNEETLWTGGPRDYNRKGAYRYLPEIRKLLFEGKRKEAEQLAEAQFMGLKSEEGNKEKWFQEMRKLPAGNKNPASVKYNDKDWLTMVVPTFEGWERAGFEGLDGAVWFRFNLTLPPDWNGKNLVLDLGKIRDQDFTYVNGKLVGSRDDKDEGRVYTVSKDILKKGPNIIAVQVLNYFDKGGMVGYKDVNRKMKAYPEGDPSSPIVLNGPWKYMIQNDSPPATPRYQADYQPFGDLELEFKNQGAMQDYRRELDLEQALSHTRYSMNGIRYTRTYFASQPDQAIVVRLSADKPGSISFNASLSSPHKYASVRKLDDHTIALSLRVKGGSLKGESYLRAVCQKGTMTVQDNKIVISGADEVTLYLTAATNYKNYKDISGDPAILCRQVLQQLEKKTYETVKAAHIQEYQQYFNTFSLKLGSNRNNKLPTDQRLQNFAKDGDPAFAAMYVQYGRYLLISSSRPGTRPANLQGIWNDLLTPPWGSKYTTNINAEMNYWPAELLNLSPMHQPLFDMIDELAEAGKETAREYYNAPGWVLHHNTDEWRGTAPINASNHGIWVTGGAWLCHHLWEHFIFTGDTAFLRDRAYPVMKQAAEFFVSFLIEDPVTGYLISTPSNSPEQGGLVAGPTMDHQIIRDLFEHCIKASELLHTDAALRDTLQQKYARIAPNKIGKYGQLQEWMQDVDDPNNKHRHVSHLWGVYPGSEINWDHTPELMRAARQSLIYRGDAGTGWSLAWKINLWARFKEGDHAYQLVRMLLTPAGRGGGGSYNNLFDAHPPFQIDGNFGGAAGIGEMLVQSQSGLIDLMPALPSDFIRGEVKGLRARGGFEINMTWDDRKIRTLELYAAAGGKCKLRYGNITIDLNTEKGRTYRFDSSLKPIN